MLEELKQKVYEANMDLPRYGLVTFTWGNVSAIDRESGLFVIKPSGVDYDKLTPEMMVVMDLNGNKVEGDLNPSSDTATHLELYKAFPEIGGIVHTHSSYATSWAQAGRDIPCYGTTHKLTPEMMVVMDLNGNKVEGDLNPSSDTATHLELYKAFPEIGGIVHTHSSYATSWAQAGRDIPCYGTTHADYIYGPVPCVRCLTKEEIEDAYEENTGHLIVNEFKRLGKDPKAVPAVLCKNHGPFAWGKDAREAVHNAVVLEEVAKMAYRAETINPRIQPAPQELQDKHYNRKHGKNAYYGQTVQK